MIMFLRRASARRCAAISARACSRESRLPCDTKEPLWSCRSFRARRSGRQGSPAVATCDATRRTRQNRRLDGVVLRHFTAGSQLRVRRRPAIVARSSPPTTRSTLGCDGILSHMHGDRREARLRRETADAFVLFGITGDLSYKMLLPALYAMEARKELNVPVIGVALTDLDVDGLRERARASLTDAKVDIDDAVFTRFAKRLRLVAGSFDDPTTFTTLATRSARRSSSRTIWPYRPVAVRRCRRRPARRGPRRRVAAGGGEAVRHRRGVGAGARRRAEEVLPGGSGSTASTTSSARSRSRTSSRSGSRTR